jgi:hypothetical protein
MLAWLWISTGVIAAAQTGRLELIRGGGSRSAAHTTVASALLLLSWPIMHRSSNLALPIKETPQTAVMLAAKTQPITDWLVKWVTPSKDVNCGAPGREYAAQQSLANPNILLFGCILINGFCNYFTLR